MPLFAQIKSSSSAEMTGMDTLPIAKLRTREVHKVIRSALRAGFDADSIDDFLASVDWSGAQNKKLKIMALLGQLENWASQYSDGDLTRPQYQARLLTLLPQQERQRRVFLEGGRVVITVAAPRGPLVRLVRSREQPQTGSRTPDQLREDESKSGSLLAV
jgi:hypothetical protein